MRRLWAGAGVAAIGIVLVGPVPAAEAAACSGSSGVTVVVDYGALGGIQVGCAAGDPASGLGALNAAGFGTTGTRKDGPGLVCRINGAPASDPCVVTPPTTAYWSYWHAPRGGAWTYSSTGAAGHNPAPGSVEGWAFGAGGRPGIAAPAAPAPPPAPITKPGPKPTVRVPAPVPTAAAPRTTAPGGGGVGGPSNGPRPRAGTPASSASGPSSASEVPSGTPAATTGSTGPGGSNAAAGSRNAATGGTTAPPTSEPGPVAGTEPVSSSTPVGSFVIGAVLVAGLGTTGFLIARRRRTPGPPSA